MNTKRNGTTRDRTRDLQIFSHDALPTELSWLVLLQYFQDIAK